MRGIVLTLGMAVTLLAPTVHAQFDDLGVSVAPFTEAVRPLGGPLATVITLDVPCDLAWDAPNNREGIALSVHDVPAWMTVTLSPQVVEIDPVSCPPHEHTLHEATMVVSVDQDAPAFIATPIRLLATGTGATGPRVADTQLVVVPDYFSLYSVTIDAGTVRAKGGVAPLGFRIDNLGNGVTRFDIEVASAPDGWTVHRPDPITLGSRQSGDGLTSAHLVARAIPSLGADTGPITLRIDSAYAVGGDPKGTSAEIVFFVSQGSVAGAAADVPGPSPFVVLLAGMGALAVRTRRG